MLQSVVNTLEEGWDSEVIMVVKEKEDEEDNYHYNYKPFEHIA